MVDAQSPVSLAALSNSMALATMNRDLPGMDKTQTSPEKQKLQWAGSRETLSLSGRGRAFFLTSLFIDIDS